jgi:hypothetical protein
MGMTLPKRYAYLNSPLAPRLIREGLKTYGTVETPGKKNNPVIMGWAKEVDGKIIPLVSAHITTSDDGWSVGKWIGEGEESTWQGVPGWFFNVRYYGESAEALANGGDPNGETIFHRFPGVKALAEYRTGEPLEWKPHRGDVPQGYRCDVYGVYLYDPQAITTPSNVFA